MGIQFFETSAKENKNVEAIFNAITQEVLLRKKEEKEDASKLKNTITLGKGRKPTRKLVMSAIRCIRELLPTPKTAK